MISRNAVFALAFAALGSGAAQAADPIRLIVEFDGPVIDTCVFKTLQADVRYLAFGQERIGGRTRTFLSNSIDGDYSDGARLPPPDTCSEPEPMASAMALLGLEEDSDIEPLGPSFVLPPASPDDVAGLQPGGLANCPGKIDGFNPETRRFGVVSQKNELRLADEHVHNVSDGHWYGFTFRALGAIPTCGTMRSVLAQWKFKYDDDRRDDDHSGLNANARSPVFALRFDNGVLHATVQSGRCTCLVAKAVGDPDFQPAPTAALALSIAGPKTPAFEAVAFEPRCRSSVPGEDGKACTPAPGFKAEYLRKVGGDGLEPVLPDPREGWVKIDAFIEGTPAPQGWPEGGRIELYANDKPIVRLTNGIGYGDAAPTTVKFKFGHYRDKIMARTRLDFDRLCIAPETGECGPRRTFSDFLE